MKIKPLYFLVIAVITALVFSGIALAISALDPSQGTIGPENSSHGDAELDDLQFVATEMGITLQEAIARYSWNDDFSRIVSDIRDASPQDFAGAAITGDTEAWVAFAGQTPSAAQGILDTFGTNFPGVSVELRTDLGFAEQEIGNAIAGAHYAVLQSAGVLDASQFLRPRQETDQRHRPDGRHKLGNLAGRPPARRGERRHRRDEGRHAGRYQRIRGRCAAQPGGRR